MSVDPNAFICHHCDRVDAGAQYINHRQGMRVEQFSPVLLQTTWWNLGNGVAKGKGGYRGLLGLCCPECMVRIDAMTDQQVAEYITSRKVAQTLTGETE